jgi:xanthine dehydrogenase accessory factor
VRIGPPGRAAEAPGDVVVAESSCASEGVVEVLVEPQVPRPLLAVVGDSAAAITLASSAKAIDWRVTTDLTGDADAVVVATMGHADEGALEVALAGRAGTSGSWRAPGEPRSCSARCESVGSAKTVWRACTVRPGSISARRPQPEIAVAILAELVAWRHTRAGESPSCSRRSIRSAG